MDTNIYTDEQANERRQSIYYSNNMSISVSSLIYIGLGKSKTERKHQTKVKHT